MARLAVGLCLGLALQRAWAPPIVTTTNPNYIGPALGPLGESPYQGPDNVFHLGAPSVCLSVCLSLPPFLSTRPSMYCRRLLHIV
jgi:hypothetical protein